MKKLLCIFIIIFCGLSAASAQKVTKDAAGNYHAAQRDTTPAAATFESLTKNANQTGATYTDAKGRKFQVFTSKSGKAFFVTQSKAGKYYRRYLDIE